MPRVSHIVYAVLGMICICMTGLVPIVASDTLDAAFQAKMRQEGIPGAAYIIVKNGQVTHVGTFGKRVKGGKGAVTPHTVFRLASVSKTFAGTLSARLVAEGKLSLNEKVKPHAPKLRLSSQSSLSALTVRHLLNHSTGLIPNAYDNMLEDGWDLPKILPRFNKVKSVCKPGNCYGYQNILFSLVEPVIEAHTDARYETLIEDLFFEPLWMGGCQPWHAGVCIRSKQGRTP